MIIKKFLTVASFVCAISLFAAEKPYDTTVGESFKNPVGYSLNDLSFSWKIPVSKNDKGEERFNIKQTAYQIVVATTEDFDKTIIWDSGKVPSDKSTKVRYTGENIKSRDRLYWKVRYWDNFGEESPWSDVSFFEAGLLDNSEWKGKWIFAKEPRVKFTRNINRPEWKTSYMSDYVPCAYFRKQFDATKRIKSARLYVASKGLFEFYVNGKKVGNEFWGTGWTDFHKRIQTNTYDITKMVWRGDNTFGAVIGDGWYSGRIGWAKGKRGMYGERPELLAQIEITYKDGTKDVVATDENWKYSFGPIVTSDIYDGEIYDARLEIEDWNENGFDDENWEIPATKPVEAKPLLEPRRNQPIVVKDVLTPISVKKLKDGRWIFDLGQNMVGWAKIKVPSIKNKTYTVGFCEMLKKDGTPYKSAYRSTQSEDIYTSNGKNYMDEWQPKFTYHGFRYVDISGIPENVKPKLDWVQGIVLYNDMPLDGSFVCDKPLVNKLQNCIQWGQRGNFFSVPTDCPQRNERLGWTGDAQVFCPTAAFNMNVEAFFTKWILDLADTSKDGNIAEWAPDFGVAPKGSAAWSDAMVICPWEIYLAYGDEKILKNNYNAMKAWVEYMKRESKNFIRPEKGYGDWLQPYAKDPRSSDAPKSLIGTAYFVRCADIMAKVAKILGKTDDVKYFTHLAKDVRAAYNNKFVSLDGIVQGDCQTSYLLTLAFDIAPESIRAKIFDHLLKSIEKADKHLRTGFVGTPLLNPVLTKFGKTDLAYKLLNNTTYPSWLFPIEQGATTMWERWNSYSHKDGFGPLGMNSFNHYAYGAVGQWLYKDVAGIWHDENAAGYKNIIFAPKPAGGLNAASASHETPYGTASSSWRISDGVMEWNVTIPPNATGTLVFPTRKAKTIRINGKKVDEKSLSIKNGIPEINVGSGTYKMLLRPMGYK